MRLKNNFENCVYNKHDEQKRTKGLFVMGLIMKDGINLFKLVGHNMEISTLIQYYPTWKYQ